MVADQELQFGAKEPHAFGAGPLEAGQVSHQTGIHLELDAGAAECFSGLVADRGIALLRLGLHRHLVAEGTDHAVIGAQMHDALIAIDKDEIAVERFCGDALGMNDQRNGERAGDYRGV